jgi:hypothetical protein
VDGFFSLFPRRCSGSKLSSPGRPALPGAVRSELQAAKTKQNVSGNPICAIARVNRVCIAITLARSSNYYLVVKVTLSVASSSVLWSAVATLSSSVCLPGLTPFRVPFSVLNIPIISPST